LEQAFLAKGRFGSHPVFSFNTKIEDHVKTVQRNDETVKNIRISGITRIESYEKVNYILKFSTGEIFPISRSHFPKLKQVLGF